MPVLPKTKRKALESELQNRFSALWDAIAGRELKTNSEGCKKGHWISPENKIATKGSDMEIRMAVDDFKTVLAEIKRIK